ncbi:MAG: peptidylprolyl isomerase [Dehalococcoidia bacterium]
MTVSAGTEVTIEYTLRLKDNTVVDTNVGSEPFTYVHGSHQIVPGLEKALEEMNIGESKQVTVKPEEGHGPVNQEAFFEVEKEKIPPRALRVGARLQTHHASGRIYYARVAEIKDETVVVDFNHLLAGKILYLEVKILSIQRIPVT